MMGQLSHSKLLPYRAVGVLDGDKDDSVGCIRLPGNSAPERMVFEALKAQQWAQLPERFGLGAGALFGHLDDAILEPDHHLWTTKVGDRVVKSRMSVWEIMANQWAKTCLPQEVAKQIAGHIQSLLI